MRVAFLENFLSIRGSTVALFDYAHYNESILGNESIVITRPYHVVADQTDASKEVYEKFRERFPVFFYTDPGDIQGILDREKEDVLYVIKYGLAHDNLHGFRGVRTIVHAVFDSRQPHGDVYCVISPWLNHAFNTKCPVLPHIVDLPESTEDLREELGIPRDAVVFGRYGGYREFDHPAARAAVERLSAERSDLYFVFINTEPFLSEKRGNVLFLPKTTDKLYKTRFINTCDAMLYARSRGETFGLAIAEFSIRNRPVFAPRDAHERMHQVFLKERAFWYKDVDHLCHQIRSFDRAKAKCVDWNAYRDFTPEKIMQIFAQALGSDLR